MKKYISFLSAAVAITTSAHAKNFSVDLNGIRNSVATTVDGKPALFLSEVAGSVACYTTDGKQLWKQSTGTPAVNFEIEAADIDGDGIDEMLAASANGNIYCWGNDGQPRWTFNPGHKVRFSEIAVLSDGAQSRIYAGGNDFKLYELDQKGALISETKIKGVVRKIEVGDFIKKGEASLFVMTYSHDKFRWEFMGLLDPKTKEVVKSLGNSKKLKNKEWGSLMVTDLTVADIDADGRDELLFFGTTKAMLGFFAALNGELEEIATFTGSKKHKQRYAHIRGECLLPTRPEIALQYGGILYVCDLKGNLLHTSGAKYKGVIYNDFVYEPINGELFGAGQVGGGNTMYRYSLSDANWWQTEHEVEGRLAEVEKNLTTLYQQALKFTPPAYQKKSQKPWVMNTSVKPTAEVTAKQGDEIIFVKQYTWHEDFDRSALVSAIGEVALKKDRRGKYNVTREEILNVARQREAQGLPFTVWAGHGTDPFYIPLETMLALLEVAPNTCYGFVYAEMSNPEDKRYHHFIDSYMPRLAKACRKNGKAKIYFRYKNVFWAASSHLAPWDRLFFSGKYSDLLVPSSEDTNSRTQDINFAGRVGMLSAGYVDDIAMRLVDDNPTCWRPLSPGGQRSVSPYLRNGVILAGYGSRSGIIFNIGYLEEPGMNVLFSLMKSGVLPEVNSEDILSIGSWHLLQDVDEKLVHEIDDGHTMEHYKPNDEDAVFSVGAVNWCGASVPDHDFSKILGVDYRWLNFMPELPNGMVPVAPIAYAEKLKEKGIPFSVSNGRHGIVDGQSVPASEYAATLNATVKSGVKKLPVLVSGASWSAIKLDETHVRLILVDPGYIDPKDCAVTVSFQTKQPSSAVDILSKEVIKIESKQIKLTVPAGSVRFIDLAY